MSSLTLMNSPFSVLPASGDPSHSWAGDGSVAARGPEETLAGGDAGRILEAAMAILDQGELLLRSVTAADYGRRVPEAFQGSLGGHYRHCLDHFTSLLRAPELGEVDYDRRERDPRVESEPEAALALTRWLRGRLERVRPADLAGTVRARCEVSYAAGESPVTRSTLGREMVYAIAHAIHHYALIAVMARLLGLELPPAFGVAPSTVAHRRAEARAGERE